MANKEVVDKIAQLSQLSIQKNEALDIWNDMGYDSQQEASMDAVRLFRALYDDGFFRSRSIVDNFIRSPKVFLMTKYMG